MSSTSLETLSRELVRFDDFLEKHGLVDYEMGVEEEQIMDRELPSLYPSNVRTNSSQSARSVSQLAQPFK